jgi:glycosyltransferase involved in cell wall biosynthesis
MSQPDVSIVVPMYNEGEGIHELIKRLDQALAEHFGALEFIFIDDGSSDDTLSILQQLKESDPRIVVIALARNFGKEAALTAGLDRASGAFVVPLDADLQDPPECIPKMIAKAREGYDVVYGQRRIRLGETWFKRLTAWGFYQVAAKLTTVSMPQNTGDFRVMTQEVVASLKLIRERNRFMKGIFAWVGYKQCAFLYDRHPRHAGGSKWNTLQLINFAIDGITSFSVKPLRASSYLGILVSLLAFIFGLFYAIKAALFGDAVQGFPTLIFAILFLGGIQLLSLGILGEYIGRIYHESKDRPLYIVKNSIPKKQSPESSFANE